jgi:hypothetical protein
VKRATIAIALWSLGCGASPTAPLDRIQMVTGDRFLNLSSSIPEGCALGFSGTHIMVAARVTFSHEGQEWIARAREPIDGDVEVRFHDTGQPSLAGLVRIEGTIRGVASDAGYRGKFLSLPGAYTGAISLTPSSGTSFYGYAGTAGLLLATDLAGVYSRSNSATKCGVEIKFWDLSVEAGPY